MSFSSLLQTGVPSFTLGIVRRCLAALLGLCLLPLTGQGLALHVHAYGDHDHVEHQHGLAAHHHDPPSHRRDSGVRLEPCDPAAHAVPLVLVVDRTTNGPAVAAEPATAAALFNAPCSCGVVPLIDARAHGPPTVTDASPRAPPALIPA
ncbi:MAG: hypothetical protein GEU99_25300 [Luteitalea sp.]|nr:hypothetical protein [Luteitalea sp.]